MKLYDYSRKRSKSKDIQFDQLDEEIRRIWDVLYNKRQQYSNQLSPSALNTFTEQKVYGAWINNAIGAGGNLDNSGCLPAPAAGGTAGAVGTLLKPEALFARRDTATTLGASAGWNSSANANSDASPNYFRISHDPKFTAIIRTGSLLTDSRIFIGFCGRPAFANNVSGQVDTTSTGFYFVFNENDPRWQIVATEGGSAGTGLVSNQYLSTVDTDSIYVLRISVDTPSGGTVIFETYKLTTVFGDGLLISGDSILEYTVEDYQKISHVYGDASISSTLSMGLGSMIFHNVAGGTAHHLYVARIYVEANNFPQYLAWPSTV